MFRESLSEVPKDKDPWKVTKKFVKTQVGLLKKNFVSTSHVKLNVPYTPSSTSYSSRFREIPDSPNLEPIAAFSQEKGQEREMSKTGDKFLATANKSNEKDTRNRAQTSHLLIRHGQPTKTGPASARSYYYGRPKAKSPEILHTNRTDYTNLNILDSSGSAFLIKDIDVSQIKDHLVKKTLRTLNSANALQSETFQSMQSSGGKPKKGVFATAPFFGSDFKKDKAEILLKQSARHIEQFNSILENDENDKTEGKLKSFLKKPQDVEGEAGSSKGFTKSMINHKERVMTADVHKHMTSYKKNIEKTYEKNNGDKKNDTMTKGRFKKAQMSFYKIKREFVKTMQESQRSKTENSQSQIRPFLARPSSKEGKTFPNKDDFSMEHVFKANPIICIRSVNNSPSSGLDAKNSKRVLKLEKKGSPSPCLSPIKSLPSNSSQKNIDPEGNGPKTNPQAEGVLRNIQAFKNENPDLVNEFLPESVDLAGLTKESIGIFLEVAGIKQTDENGEDKLKKLVEFDEKLRQELHGWIKRMSDKFKGVSEEHKRIYNYNKMANARKLDYFNTFPTSLSVMELSMVKSEYSKPANMRNYRAIDKVLKKLKFFSPLPENVRMIILPKAHLIHVPAGEIVFKQDDYGDLMYIILKGCCMVRTEKTSKFGIKTSQIVNSLFDGSHFGELAMMSSKKDYISVQKKGKKEKEIDKNADLKSDREKKEELESLRTCSLGSEINGSKDSDLIELESETQEHEAAQKIKEEEEKATKGKEEYFERTKRAATIEAAETCELLALSRSDYQNILLNSLQKQLDMKLRTLHHIDFLKRLEPFQLIPVASNVRVKTFTLGEIIVQEGQELEYFYIVASGRCRIVKEIMLQRNQKIMPQSKLNTWIQVAPQDPRALTEEKLDDAEQKSKMLRQYDVPGIHEVVKKAEKNPIHLASYKNQPSLSATTFQNEKIFQEGEILIHKEHLELGTFTRGGFFGGRVLVEPEPMEGNESPKKLKAKLSIVSDSPQTECYLLSKKNFAFIPAKVQKTFLDFLSKNKEFDEIDTKQAIKEHLSWLRAKDSLTKETQIMIHDEKAANCAKYK